MPVEVTYLDGGKGVLTLGEGVVTGRDMIEANQYIFSSGEHTREYRYGLTDFSHMDSVEASTSEVEEIARINVSAAEIVPDYVAAIVARQDLIFGLSRMWEAHLEKNGWETRVFRTTDKAKAWIKHRVKEKFGIDVTIT